MTMVSDDGMLSTTVVEMSVQSYKQMLTIVDDDKNLLMMVVMVRGDDDDDLSTTVVKINNVKKEC